MPREDFVVTPWEVSGEVDYGKLIERFGVEIISDRLLKRIKKHTKDIHLLVRRKIFFAHRDLNWILNEYEKGNRFYLYTGRGPSGHTHLGHLTPWFLTKWIQDKFKVKLYFQMTDDEKFLFNQKLSIEKANEYSYENALDVIALGFDPKKTIIFSDIDYAKSLYREALKVAKKLTFSTTRATFGFNNESNVGQIFFTSVQAVPAFLESVKQKKNVPCLIPHAIDQDPHFRIARDILPRLGYYKPASIQGKFLPGLGNKDKMSASQPETAIFTVDQPEQARKKIMNAFTGGRETIEEQRRLGGRPEICPVYHYYEFLFEKDDKALEEIGEACKSGELLCGEDKERLAERVMEFLKVHQKKREKARDRLEDYVVKD